jgi:hypothetical protein
MFRALAAPARLALAPRALAPLVSRRALHCLVRRAAPAWAGDAVMPDGSITKLTSAQ